MTASLAALLYRRYDGAVDENGADRAPLPEYSEDGVDLTLIRWMLSLTPLQRLQFLVKRTIDILRIRELNAGR
jgi:hypothetical protein